MNENYWKDAYQNTWDKASKREKRLMARLEKMAGVKCSESGLGAGSTAYISGSAERNGYQKDGTTYGKYVMNWLNFTDSLKEGKNVRLNMELGSVDSCLEGWPGRLVDVEV